MNWSPELDCDLPKYQAILKALSRAIETGELKANDRLPAQRDLAYRLNINLSTVTRAFNHAIKQGLISGEVGRGTFVMPESSEARLFARGENMQIRRDFSTLGPMSVDSQLISSVMRQLPPDEIEQIFHYPNDLQIHRAEQAVAHWSRWRGYDPAGKTTVLTVGAQAALYVTLAMMTNPGQTILTESFTFPGIKTVARFTGTRLQGVECDNYGLLPDALEQAARQTGAKILVTVSNLQNPMALITSDQRRKELAKVIENCNITVIEDDIYGAFVQKPPLVSQLEGQHICINSLSKCFSPGLRFGYLIGNHPAVAQIKKEIAMTSWFSSPIMMLTSAHLILSGRAQIEALRQINAIEQRWKTVQRIFDGAGKTPLTHLWLSVRNAESFVAQARERHIELVPSSFFSVGRRSENFVRCALTAPKEEQDFAQGLKIIKELGAELSH